MNLIVDQGNSRYKLAVYDKNQLVELLHEDGAIDLKSLESWLNGFPEIERCIISTVGEADTNLVAFVGNRYQTTRLTNTSKLPFRMNYATPDTLGVDRMALVSAAAFQYPKQNVLVIDAGSCITFDFLDAENTYHGGAIAPGLRMRYQALHEQTAGLPLLEPKQPKSGIGNSTAQSMHVGVVSGMSYEIDASIEHYRATFGNLTVILTGGDAHFLRDSIKNDIFAHPNFLLEGLNHLLEVNSSTF